MEWIPVPCVVQVKIWIMHGFLPEAHGIQIMAIVVQDQAQKNAVEHIAESGVEIPVVPVL